MVDWLINRFVPHADDVEDPTVRESYGRVASIVSIICNVILCVGKGVVGALSGSVSIVADAVNNLSDASSNVVTLLGFRMASRPPDEEHPYGHGRYEYLSGLVIAVLIVSIGLELLKTSADKIANPTATEFSMAVVVVLVASILVKAWMSVFNRTAGRRITSTALEATAADSRNDVITTGAVLAAAIISHYTGIDLDGWAGLAVGVFIVASGIGLVRDTMSPLLGQAPDPKLVDHIHTKIMGYPGVLGTHDLMVHDYGPGRQFASAHVEMAAETDPLQSHDTIDNIEQDFREQDHLVLVLHYDPIVTTDPKVSALHDAIATGVMTIDPRLTIHDLRCVPGPTHTNVIFDCVRPHDLDMTDEELKAAIAPIVLSAEPKAVPKVTIDSSYVSAK
jgi:cation diffusion facilitator family transporter